MSKIKEKTIVAREKVVESARNKVAKLPGRRKKNEPPLRITNDTVAEHREKILAGGRKFKYPLQQQKHKILINAIIVAIVASVIFVVWVWVMLYRVQATSDFFYGVTKIVPLPVASVDGQKVRYSDYLRRIRADIFYYENQEGKSFKTTDGRRELEYNKRRELTAAQRTAYAYKIARLRNISLPTDKEVSEKINATMKSDGSDEAAVIRMLRAYYNWTMDEYRQTIRDQLLEQKVSFAIDSSAKNKVSKIQDRLKNGEDFATVAKETSDDPMAKETGGAVVAQSGDLDSNGLIAAARNLSEGEISQPIEGRNDSGDYSYFIVKLDSKTDTETRYSVIMINLTQFDKEFSNLQKEGSIREFIKVPAAEAAA